MQRVTERGRPEDSCAAFNMYGGMEGFKDIAREAAYLSPTDMNFLCVFFNMKKEESRCCTPRQSRKPARPNESNCVF